MANICVKALVKGHVQGVGFRFHTAHQGVSLALNGYAKNLADGNVEVMACGEQQQVEQLLIWLQQGPKMARVDDVSIEPLEWRHYEGFAMK